MHSTFTITVDEADDTPVTWRAESYDDDGTIVEDFTYTLPAEHVPGFANAFLGFGLAVAARSVETDNLAPVGYPTEGTYVPTPSELAAVEASFPTGEQVDAEDELRERLTAEGIAHGNF